MATGKSLRAIGRDIAKEIEKYFEVEVKPETIRKKAERLAGTNVPPDPAPKIIQKTTTINAHRARHGENTENVQPCPILVSLLGENDNFSFQAIRTTVL
jgi:hypothetical protein